MSLSEENGLNGHDDVIANVTFAELCLGQSASLTRLLGKTEIELFAAVSGDINPSHLDENYAIGSQFHTVVGHSLWSGSLISGVLGTVLPGPGTVYVRQDLRFHRPTFLGDTLTATVVVKEKHVATRTVLLDCLCVNQHGEVVMTGVAEVLAPEKKIIRPRIELPQVQMIHHDGFQPLMERCAMLEPTPVAVVHPCDESSLRGAVEAAEAGLIDPVLIGPESRIRYLADTHQIDISQYRLVNCEHSHAAAGIGVALARTGDVGSVMKGSLHTDELMSEVMKRDTGLRTARRISHVFVMSVPTYPRTLLITDAAINIYPTLEDKADICQNAIDLAHVLGVETPRVAILSAVETVNPKIASTLEAAALCKMADRGQIKGGLLDGPLAFDNAISEEAAKTKGIVSPVAGRADILLVPDLEAGNMLAKQLSFLANADAAGIVLGTRVPLILTSRADTVRTRLASCAVAVLVAEARRKATTL